MSETRERLINSAYEEIYSKGFQGAALADILSDAKVHKGSMYYFFQSKKELALAVLNEKIRVATVEKYKAVAQQEGAFLSGLMSVLKDNSTVDFKRGCPLANLAQEMSNLDEDFDRALKEIYGEITYAVWEILDKAVKSKEMRECDTLAIAEFIIAVKQGALFSAKISGDAGQYDRAMIRLEKYLGLFGIVA